VANNEALGNTGISEVQRLTVTGAPTFTLSFKGSADSVPLTLTGSSVIDAIAIQNALLALETIGGGADVGGTVTVTPDVTGKIFTVTFGGTLSNFNLPNLVPT